MNSTSGWVGEKVLFLKGEYTESSDMYIVHTLELKMVVSALTFWITEGTFVGIRFRQSGKLDFGVDNEIK
jgi:hypothetical protein